MGLGCVVMGGHVSIELGRVLLPRVVDGGVSKYARYESESCWIGLCRESVA